MLQDLLALEQFYGSSGATLFIEDMLEQYGQEQVQEAFAQGHLMQRLICLGPDCGRCLCWLSEEGRRMAALHIYCTKT